MDAGSNPVTRFLADNFMDSSYCIGYRFGSANFWNEDMSEFRVLKPSLRYWYADPVPFRHKGRFYVFMERYDCFRNIGCIAAAEASHRGRLGRPRVVISGRTHLSFPMIVPFKGNYYMLPETSATRSIDVFRMGETPYHWERYYSMGLGEEIVDVAWVADNDDILLLGGVVDRENPMRVRRQVIRVSHLDDIRRLRYRVGYTDEGASPEARNGGAFLNGGGGLYRVAQESTDKIYGLALILNKVSRLSDSNIDETGIKRKTVENIDVKLNKCFYKKVGIHTYGLCDGVFEVIDISAVKWSAVPLLKKLKFLTA